MQKKEFISFPPRIPLDPKNTATSKDLHPILDNDSNAKLRKAKIPLYLS
jgi:hypothetical protein